MSNDSDKEADAAMALIWEKWFQFYNNHFRASGVAISAADQMAFYEIAQPILRRLRNDDQRKQRRLARKAAICNRSMVLT